MLLSLPVVDLIRDVVLVILVAVLIGVLLRLVLREIKVLDADAEGIQENLTGSSKQAGNDEMKLREMNALDVFSMPEDLYEQRVVFATPGVRALVIEGPGLTSEGRESRGGGGILDAGLLFQEQNAMGNEKEVEFVCGSPGAAWALRLIARSYGVQEPSSIKIRIGSKRGPGSEISCSLEPVGVRSRALSPSSSSSLTRGGVQDLNRVVYDYWSRSQARMNQAAPFVRKRSLLISDVCPWFPGRQRSLDFWCCEDLLVVPEYQSRSGQVRSLAAREFRNASNADVGRNNLFAAYFLYAEPSIQELRSLNSGILVNQVSSDSSVSGRGSRGGGSRDSRAGGSGRDSRAGGSGLDIVLRDPAGGRYGLRHGGRVRTVVLNPPEAAGIPVGLGDRIKLEGQMREVENGLYLVVQRTQSEALLTSPGVVVFDPAGMRVRVDSSGCRFILLDSAGDIQKLGIRDGDRVFVAAASGSSSRGSGFQEDFGTVSNGETRITLECSALTPLEDDAEKFHPKSMCFPDTSIEIRELCESSLDAKGRPKIPGTWDRPCERDAECPYFRTPDSVSQLPRGGCNISGYCEMPLGVRRVSYRVAEGSPLLSESGQPAFRGDSLPAEVHVGK
jgi:hypothetical protein